MIPFNRPFIVGKELQYISKAVDMGKLAGNGYFSRKCQNWMEERFNILKVLLTTSCTMALEMAAILLDIKDGDEVILPSYTFVSTANAFLRNGANLVFVDIRPDTLNMDESSLESLITEKTKAIVPVHYASVGCNMDKIMHIANKYSIAVVEDAAQAVNASYKDKFLGTFGDFGTYSFHETKNFICGEGGALLINNPKYVKRAEIVHEKGTNRTQFFRGEVDKYTWVDKGSSFLPSEINAAFLYAQLEESVKITKKRYQIFEYYFYMLQPLEAMGKVRLPYLPSECRHNGHMFYLLLIESDRDYFINFLKSNGIHAVFHYVPLHYSPMGQKVTKSLTSLPVTESLSEKIVRLPCYYDLSKEEQDFIIRQIFKFFSLDFPKNHKQKVTQKSDSLADVAP